MELKMWDIGWLPAGWERGMSLRTLNPNFRQGLDAGFEQVRSSGPRAGGTRFDARVWAITFQRHDRGRVERWLLWYFDSDPEAYRVIAQIQ